MRIYLFKLTTIICILLLNNLSISSQCDYDVPLSIAPVFVEDGCFESHIAVNWTDNSSTVQISGNDLNRTSGTGWNAGAYSTDVISNEMAVYTVIDETNTIRGFGLNDNQTNYSYADINYALIPWSNGTMRIYEEGAYRGTFGTYASGDTLEVRFENNEITYHNNGTLIYTSIITPPTTMFVDAILYTNGSTLKEVHLKHKTDGNFEATLSSSGSPTYEWFLNGSSTGVTTSTYFNNSLADGDEITCQADPNITNCLPVLINSNLITIKESAPDVSLSIAPVFVEDGCFESHIAVNWTDNSSTVQISGNDLNRTSGTGWNAGAYSTDVISNEMAVYTVIDETNTIRGFGLNDNQTNYSYADINYALIPWSNGTMRIYEEGAYRGTFGTYASGDTLEVRFENNEITYHNNGTLIYTSIITPPTTMFVDAILYTNGSTLKEVHLKHKTDGNFEATLSSSGSPTYEWFLNGSSTGVTTSTYFNNSLADGDEITCQADPNITNCLPVLINSNLITIKESAPDVSLSIAPVFVEDGCFESHIAVNWTDNSSTVQISGNDLNRTSGTGWNAGAYSTDVISNEMAVYTVIDETNTIRGFGLNDNQTNYSYADINYALIPWSNGTMRIYEEGAYRGTFGTYASGDTLEVRFENNEITYHNNGTLIYTSIITPPTTMFVDAILYTNGSTLKEVHLKHKTDGNFEATLSSSGSPTYEWFLNGSSTGVTTSTYFNNSLADGDEITCQADPNITNCLPVLINSNLITIKESAPDVSLSIAPVFVEDGCFESHIAVNWTDNSSTVQISGNDLNRTSGTGWNAGAYSTDVISNEMAVYTVIDETNTIRGFGLNDNQTNYSYADINYALIPWSNGTMRIYEEGAYRGTFGTYASGDTLEVRFENNEITYHNNGTLIYTSIITPPTTMFVDAILYTNGSTLKEVHLKHKTDGNFEATLSSSGSPTYEWFLNGSSTGVTTSTYFNNSLADGDEITCQADPNITNCLPVLINSNLITIKESAPDVSLSIAPVFVEDGCFESHIAVNWTDNSSTVQISGNDLNRTSGTGWNAGAYSTDVISNEMAVYTVIDETNTIRGFGLNDNQTNYSYADINYALIPWSNGTMRIYEEGAYRGTFGTYASGDTLEVRFENNEITYHNNGTLIYTSIITPPTTMFVDAILYTNGSTLKEVHLKHKTDGNFEATLSSSGSPTYEWFLNGSSTGVTTSTYFNNSLADGDEITCQADPNITNCLPVLINSNLITIKESAPDVSLSIAPVFVEDGCFESHIAVNWTDNSSTVQISGNDLNRTSGTGWNAGAYSTDVISNEMAVYTVIDETNTIRGFGLNDNQTNYSYADINYALIPWSNGTMRIYEEGAYRGTFGTYASGDTLEVRFENNEITYHNNGTLIYTSIITPPTTMFVDAILYTNGSTLKEVHLKHKTDGNFEATLSSSGSPTYEWFLNGSSTGVTTSTYFNNSLADGDEITCQADPNITNCLPVLINSNLITIKESAPDVSLSIAPVFVEDGCFESHIAVNWTDNSSTVQISGNDLNRTSGTGWNAGAYSTDVISNEMAVYTVIDETNTIRGFGLNDNQTNYSYADINYALIPWSNGTMRIYEEGAYRGTFGTYASGDTLEVRFENNEITYHNNGTLIYTSIITPPTTMFVDAILYTNGSTLKEVHLKHKTDGNFEATLSSSGSPTYEWFLNGSSTGVTTSTYFNNSLADGDEITCQADPNITNCLPVLINSNLITIKESALDVSFSLFPHQVSDNCLFTFQDIMWTGVSTVIQSSNGDLIRTSGTGWNAGAYNSEIIGNGTSVYTIIDETNTIRGFGLNDNQTNYSYTDINYALIPWSNGTMRIYEEGTYRGTFGTYASGDTLEVRFENNEITYHNNGTLIYTSIITPPAAMFVDAILYTNGSTLKEVKLRKTLDGSIHTKLSHNTGNPSYEWYLNGMLVGNDESSYLNEYFQTGDELYCTVIPDIENCNGLVVVSDTLTFESGSSSGITDWLGVNTDWFDPLNWSFGIPTAQKTVQIGGGLANYPEINTAAYCHDLIIKPAGSLTVNSLDSLTISNNFYNEGNFICNHCNISFLSFCSSKSIYNSTPTNFYNININVEEKIEIRGDTLNLKGDLSIRNGQFITNDLLCLNSDIDETARISRIFAGADIVGKIKINRYIEAGATNWRLLTSPVQGMTLEDFDDDFLSSGFAGTDWPNWPTLSNPWSSMYFYDETIGTSYNDGFLVPSSTSESIATGQGVSIWCGDALSGTAPFVIDLFGEPNKGNINLPVTYTNTGDLQGDGWNLVANPYPCPIDWDASSWVRSNIDDAVYIWDPQAQQYTSYVGGVGVNGGSKHIASSQAFWVKSNNTFPSITIKEECKVRDHYEFIKSASPQVIRLEISDSISLAETVVRFETNATSDFDGQYDAAYIHDPNPTYKFDMYTTVNGNDYSINCLPKNNSAQNIPLTISVPSTGNYEIKASDLSGGSDFNCLLLEDIQTGVFTDLLSDSAYAFNVSGGLISISRFILHFNPSLELSVQDITCFGEVNGSILIENPTIGDTYDFYESNTNLIVSNVLFMDSVSAGVYSIQSSNLNCPSQSISVTISEPDKISATYSILDESCNNCCDGEVNIAVSGGLAPHQITLNSINSGLLTFDSLCSGHHSIYISDSKGCSYFDSVIVGSSLPTEVESIEPHLIVYPNPVTTNFYIHSNQTSLEGSEFQIISNDGKIVKQGRVDHNQEINVNSLSSGYYTLTLWKHKIIYTTNLFIHK